MDLKATSWSFESVGLLRKTNIHILFYSISTVNQMIQQPLEIQSKYSFFSWNLNGQSTRYSIKIQWRLAALEYPPTYSLQCSMIFHQRGSFRKTDSTHSEEWSSLFNFLQSVTQSVDIPVDLQLSTQEVLPCSSCSYNVIDPLIIGTVLNNSLIAPHQ